MKTKELKQLTDLDLDKKILEIKKELIKSNAQIALGQGAKISAQTRTYKKTIARIETIKNERLK